MELTVIIIVGILFSILGLVFSLTVVVGLPGAWMTLGLAAAIELGDALYRPDGTQTFPWWLLGACLVLAILGEIMEFGAGALGAKHAGSSRRGVIGSLIGGVIGAVAGVFIPVPLLGSLIGAVVGTFVGAIVGELSGSEMTAKSAVMPATGASIGRLLGTLAKVPIAMTVWLALSVAVFWP